MPSKQERKTIYGRSCSHCRDAKRACVLEEGACKRCKTRGLTCTPFNPKQRQQLSNIDAKLLPSTGSICDFSAEDDDWGFALFPPELQPPPFYEDNANDTPFPSLCLSVSPFHSALPLASLFTASRPSFSFPAAFAEIGRLMDGAVAGALATPRFVRVMAEAEGGKVWSVRGYVDLRSAMFRETLRAAARDVLELGLAGSLFARGALSGTRLEGVEEAWGMLAESPELVLTATEVALIIHQIVRKRPPPAPLPRLQSVFRFTLTLLAEACASDSVFAEAELPPHLAVTAGEKTKAFLLDPASPDGIRSDPPWFDRSLFQRHVDLKRMVQKGMQIQDIVKAMSE